MVDWEMLHRICEEHEGYCQWFGTDIGIFDKRQGTTNLGVCITGVVVVVAGFTGVVTGLVGSVFTFGTSVGVAIGGGALYRYRRAYHCHSGLSIRRKEDVSNEQHAKIYHI